MNSEVFLKDFFSSIDSLILERNKNFEMHEKVLNELWGKPLCYTEALAEKFFKLFSEHFAEAREKATLDYAIVTIIGKALLRIEEVIILLKKGYPDGAMAISRSLHELTVCCLFIIKHRDNTDLVERYFDYLKIEPYRDLLALKETSNQMGYEFECDQFIEEQDQLRSEMKQKHGNNILNDYGWSFCVPGINKFTDMERAVGGNALRTYYRMGCNAIHSSPKSNSYSLGTLDTESNKIILLGPSIQGLALPARFTLISISALITGLYSYFEYDDSEFYNKAYRNLILEILNEFNRSSERASKKQ